MKRGAAYLLNATVEDDAYLLAFDGLKRVTGSSRLEDFHYIPVLFSEAERPGREQRALLATLGIILGPFQGREPGWGAASGAGS